jgi:DNA repair exonuclease SbcCD nuclease subunit
MKKFAHMADLHLGAHREPALMELEMRVFDEAMGRCLSGKVDFILISGDLFHVGIPDLEIVNRTVRKMRDLREAGIRIYAIYGSHDYNPSSTSIIDIIETAGLLTNLSKWKTVDGKIELEVFEDQSTGAKLCGISARKMGLESKHYELLDKQPLESQAGFKVFAFHSGITEFKPDYLSEMETIPISYLPKGFDYYAGGHIHQRGEFSLPGYDRVVFPGPLFTGYGKDIETTARGERRGFYEVEFDERVRKVAFVPMDTFGGSYLEYDATGKNAVEAWTQIQRDTEELDVADKVVALKIRGELSGGRTSDINFTQLRTRLMEKGALFVYLNRHGLSSKEYVVTRHPDEDQSSIEGRTLEEGIGKVKVAIASLKGEKGVQTAKHLLATLRQGAKSDESKKAYSDRMVEDGEVVLGLKEGQVK